MLLFAAAAPFAAPFFLIRVSGLRRRKKRSLFVVKSPPAILLRPVGNPKGLVFADWLSFGGAGGRKVHDKKETAFFEH